MTKQQQQHTKQQQQQQTKHETNKQTLSLSLLKKNILKPRSGAPKASRLG